MSGKEIKELRKTIGLSQQEMAAVVGVDFKTVNRWENEKAKPSQLAIRVLNRLKRKHGRKLNNQVKQSRRLERKCALNDAGAGDTHGGSK